MKTVTLDYETYEAELKQKFEEGRALGTKAFDEATDLFIRLARRDYDPNIESALLRWIRDYVK